MLGSKRMCKCSGLSRSFSSDELLAMNLWRVEVILSRQLNTIEWVQVCSHVISWDYQNLLTSWLFSGHHCDCTILSSWSSDGPHSTCLLRPTTSAERYWQLSLYSHVKKIDGSHASGFYWSALRFIYKQEEYTLTSRENLGSRIEELQDHLPRFGIVVNGLVWSSRLVCICSSMFIFRHSSVFFELMKYEHCQ